MSSAELLLTFVVALLVFGPKKLPMLAEHLGKLFRHLDYFKNQAAQFWQNQLNEQQLQENLRKAEQAETDSQSKRETGLWQ